MSFTTEFANNPLFIHDMDKLCAICFKKLDKVNIHSIFATIPKLEPEMNAMEVLDSISNYNSKSGPQNMCATCFNNIAAAYKFQQICNRAHETIQTYLRHQAEMEMKAQEDRLANEEPAEVIEIKIENLDRLAKDDNDEEEQDETMTSDVEEVNETVVQSEKYVLLGKRSKCKVCHKMYRHDYLPVHMRTHTGEKPYQCKTCNRTFAQATTLKLHEVSHTDDRQFICNFCGKGFKMWRTLRGHERTHTGEKPYKCNECDKTFAHDSSRKGHYVSAHTNEKPYQCEVCAKCFGRMTGLRQHLISHATVKKHECHLCGNRFTQAHSLRTHLKASCQART